MAAGVPEDPDATAVTLISMTRLAVKVSSGTSWATRGSSFDSALLGIRGLLVVFGWGYGVCSKLLRPPRNRSPRKASRPSGRLCASPRRVFFPGRLLNEIHPELKEGM
nr:hypothetical protein [Tanacetum cinerariifolium]